MSYNLEITENNTTYQVVVDTMAGVSNGPSAYEVAVSNGFTGTEAEWLQSLVGADGVDGADGIDGSLYDDTAIQAEVDLNTAKVSNINHPLVEAAVPSGAIFTDTIYDDTSIQAEVDLNTAKVSNIDHPLVEAAVPVGAVFTDTLYDDTAIQAEVDLNTAKVGITTTQANDITANNAKVTNVDHPLVEAAVPIGAVFTDTDTVYDDTTIQAEVDLNTAKVGITTQQASDITANKSVVISFAISDETTDIATGTENLTMRMPHGMTLTDVRASVTTAPVGSTIIVDVNQNGTSIFTTDLLSIDAGEKTSTTAATSAYITTSALTDDAEITIDIDQVGSTTAGSGLKIYLIGTKS